MIRKIVTDYLDSLNIDKKKYLKLPEYINALSAGGYRGYLSSSTYTKYNKEILKKPNNIKPLNFILSKCKMKQCNKCNNVLDLSDFAKNAANEDNLQTYCKSCHYITTAITQAHRTAKYRNGKENRTPLWVSEEDNWLINEFYSLSKLREKTTNIKWHVDHVIPLHGKLVSGLHVPNNLQVIPATYNLTKSNKYKRD